MNIKWAADLTTQIVNGSGNGTTIIDDWKKAEFLQLRAQEPITVQRATQV